jgi:hypothetical protein
MAFWDSFYGYRKKRFGAPVGPARSRVERELDYARAEYRKACAWGWSFSNLRPVVRERSLEPAAIVNPFIPTPTVFLSPASPDCRTIVQSLALWESRARLWEKSLEAPGNKEPLPLADLPSLMVSWASARSKLAELVARAQELAREISSIEQNGGLAAGLYGDLAATRVRIVRARWEPVTIEGQINDVRQKGVDAAAGLGKEQQSEQESPDGRAEPQRALRTWTYSTGKHRFQAQLVSVVGNQVTLRKPSGQTISMPLGRLRKEDQAWVRGQPGGPK